MSWREDLAVLRHRDVRIFVSACFVAMLGSSIAPIALVFAVLDVSDSATAVGVVLAARSIPNVVFLLIGGVIADRLPRHLVLIVANSLSALTQALAAVLVLSGHAQIWQLVVIEAVNGAAVAGVIVGFTSPGIGLAVDAATFALAVVLLLKLTLPPVERATTSILRDLRDGWTEFVSRQWVWSMVAAAATSAKAVQLYGAGVYLVVVVLTLMVPAVWRLQRYAASD